MRVDERLAYHRLLRGAPRRAWWIALGVCVLGVLFVVLQSVVLFAALRVGGLDAGAAWELMSGEGEITPVFLAGVNLGWAVMIPVALGLVLALHGLRPGWLSSVTRRLRWRWMLTCFGLSFLALLATLVVSAVVPAQDTVAVDGSLNDFTSTTRDFLLVVLLLTPLQAAGEEYAFRGYLTQAFGGLFAHARTALVLAVVVPAVLFALLHGPQDPPVFVDRLAFGLVAGALVVLTGGLEAGIAMHVLNNFLAFGIALAFTDMTTALNPTGGTWWSLPVTMTQSLVYLGVVVWWARRRGIATSVGVGEVAVLAARRSRV
ncbi:CPBP family intramembrane glutamic endopeptidase [Nocardioides sp. 31GB23]|uniref:CPBP family intramembrane glutamic endopeptidase n=1 Tax=Nocardioides sp. 31GB23 TaxID=3156065 RepID=UPI0032AF9A64